MLRSGWGTVSQSLDQTAEAYTTQEQIRKPKRKIRQTIQQMAVHYSGSIQVQGNKTESRENRKLKVLSCDPG